MSNFDFLKNYDEKLYKSAINVEDSIIKTSPGAVKNYATPFLQRVLELLLAEIGQKFNSRKKFYYQLDAVYREGKISYGFKQRIYDAYQLRSRIHDDIEEMERSELLIAQQLHEKLFYISKKLYMDFCPDRDKYEWVGEFRPIEIDNSEREVDLLEIPDFSLINDFGYDYCIICGEPNHSSDSLCCWRCNREMDNANNFISIRNHFAKEKTLTEDKLIRYGIPEGYVKQLVSSMVRENLLVVKGREITFNNMYLDKYLSKIDSYISICELITKFRQGKLTPAEIKQTQEYRLGSREEKPFYQFYKIVDHEIIFIFEDYLVTNRDIWKSMDHSAITQEQLKRWYEINLANHQRHQFNEAFKVFNDLLIEEYLDLKSQGILEAEIKETLNVSDGVYDFWITYDANFERKVKQIKIDLLMEAIKDGKTRPEVIEYAGVTSSEYENLIKFSDFKGNEFSKLRNKEIESRKREFVKYLYNFDLRIACVKSKFTVDDFYDYYDSADVNSQFYVKSTRMLMDKYLTLRRMGKTKAEAIERAGIRQKYMHRWLNRSIYADFKDEDLHVTVELVIKCFKQNRPMDEIEEISGMDVSAIRRNILLGEKGSEVFRPLYEYYEAKIIPKKLSKFLETKNRYSFRESLQASGLTEEEFDKYCELGKSGDECFVDFYEEVYPFKRSIYLKHLLDGKSQKIALKESGFTEDEYEEHKDDLNSSISTIKRIIVMDEITNNKTSALAAKKANVTVEEIYDWYFKGKDGDETYEKFYEVFHGGYVRPAINAIQKSMDNNESHLDYMIRHNKDKFTKKDVEIWVKSGLLDNKVLVSLENYDKKDKKRKSKFDSNEMLKEMGIEDYDRVSTRKNSNSSSILSRNDYDEEEMKRQIMKNK